MIAATESSTQWLPSNALSLLFSVTPSIIPETFQTKCLKIIPVEQAVDMSQAAKRKKQGVINVKSEVWDFSSVTESSLTSIEHVSRHSDGIVIILSEQNIVETDEFLETKLKNVISSNPNAEFFVLSIAFQIQNDGNRFKLPRSLTALPVIHQRLCLSNSGSDDVITTKDTATIKEAFKKFLCTLYSNILDQRESAI